MQFPGKTLPYVSVIIPTYRDWDALDLCLRALVKQTYPKDRFEVLIVNNDPDSSCPFSLPDSNMKLICEERRGSYAARNSGIERSEGDVIALTDSDCIPDGCWIENAVEVLNGGADRVAGKVELFYHADKLTAAELYEKVFAFDQQSYIELFGASVTANLVVKRNVFNAVGLFDSALMSGGDMEWGRRATSKGFSLALSPNVVVRHPARKTLKELLIKSKRVTAGAIGLGYFGETSGRFRFRGIAPPIKLLPLIRDRGNLTLGEKVVVFHVAYLLKLHKVYCRLISRSKSAARASNL